MQHTRRTRAREEWRLRNHVPSTDALTRTPPPAPTPSPAAPERSASSCLPPAEPAPRRAALVTTMRFNATSIDSFICYYLYIGFYKLYVYADDASDPIVDAARSYPSERVAIIVRDAKLEREWQALPSWQRLAMYVGSEVQARQQLNCEHCMDKCRAAKLDWLLHVDSDELLWLPEMVAGEHATERGKRSPLQRHLELLDKRGALIFTYRNLEAVPEQLECADPFREIDLFKQHSSQLDPHRTAVARAMRYWTEAEGAGGEYFRFYENGKSMVRVHESMRVAASVHEWTLPSKEAVQSAGYTNNRNLHHSSYIPHQRMRIDEAYGAVLLHFPVCSFSVFWNKRWAALGYASPNHRFRGGGGGLDQRANALMLGQRRDEAEALYRRSMMIDSETQLKLQLDASVCLRNTALRTVVESGRAHLLPSAARSRVATSPFAPAAAGGAASPLPALNADLNAELVQATAVVTMGANDGCDW